MTAVAFAIPGDLAALTGGYGYDRHMLALLPRYGVEVSHIALPSGFPSPSRQEIEHTLALIGAAPEDAVLVDGLAYGPLPADALADLKRPLVALVHHPLGYESGLTPERRQALIASERAALAVATAIIVTSPSTKALLTEEFGVSGDKIIVAVPGTDPAPRAAGSHGRTVQILAVGSIIPRKAYDLLVEALQRLAPLDWHLTIAGGHLRAPKAAAELVRRIDAVGFTSRVTLLGEVDAGRLDALYSNTDLFVMPSLFEGYGMALAEALARGLPILSTTGGAAAATVPDAAALKVPPGDVEALSNGLALLIADRDLRQRMADAAWQSGQALPRWDDTAARIAEVLKNVAMGAEPVR